MEPDNSDDWRGRQIGEAIRSVSARLKADGFSPQIIAPSTAAAGKAPAYIDEMMAVPGAPALVSHGHRLRHIVCLAARGAARSIH